MTGPIATDSELKLALAAFQANAKDGIFRASRYRMRYFSWGSGPPLIFIPGMSDRAEGFAMVMHRLAESHTCIAYELPDGKTDGSRLASYSHENYTGDLLELLDHLNLSRVAVLGSSFGSTVALASLAHWPERFTHGILQGGFAHRPLNFVQRCLCRTGQYWPGWIADWPALYRKIMWRVERPTLTIIPPRVADFLFKNGGCTTLQTLALRSLMIDRIDLRKILPIIQTPILMIGGDRDPLVPKPCEEEIVRSLPHVQRVEFSGCGHYPHYSHPVPMGEEVRKFLGSAAAIHLLKLTVKAP